MSGNKPLKNIQGITTNGLNIAAIEGEPPIFENFDPKTLLIDETYQRNISTRSFKIIEKIIKGWDWRAFKPPVVMKTASGYCVIDGQHTSIAAASHPEIKTIPCMIVSSGGVNVQAAAFVKHNRDRTAISPTQLHTALVTAGDEDALTILQICDRAGARILKGNSKDGNYAIGDIVAISTLHQILNRRYTQGTRIIVELCVAAKLAPISRDHLKAVETLLFNDDYAQYVTPESLALTLREHAPTLERSSKIFASEHGIPQWRAMVSVLFKLHPKSKRNAAA